MPKQIIVKSNSRAQQIKFHFRYSTVTNPFSGIRSYPLISNGACNSSKVRPWFELTQSVFKIYDLPEGSLERCGGAVLGVPRSKTKR